MQANMSITRRFLWYVWPYWAVQFGVLFISTGPRADSMWLWWVITLGFNGMCFLMAWDIERRRQKNRELAHKIRQELYDRQQTTDTETE